MVNLTLTGKPCEADWWNTEDAEDAEAWSDPEQEAEQEYEVVKFREVVASFVDEAGLTLALALLPWIVLIHLMF